MFARYNLTLDINQLDDCYETGNKIFSAHKNKLEKNLEPYLSVEGSLDASAIEDDWFPSIDANVFLSHSHKDEKLVISFAGFLFKNYGIKSFIDSTVWGYANDLLKKIDNKYCLPEKKPGGGFSYSYDLRNQSTAHVFLMLQGALAKMINKTECLMFVNTPNSLSYKDINEENATGSPWIYSELLMADTFPPRNADYYHIMDSEMSNLLLEGYGPNIKYEVNLKEFRKITINDIKTSANKVKEKNARKILNQIYFDTGFIKPLEIIGG